MSQAALVAQHRAKLQQAKLASQQQQQQQQSRPTTAASASDPFAAYGSRPTSTSSNSNSLGGGGGGIGGLYGMSDRDRQSTSPGALQMDDTADASDHSFNSPANKPTSTEQWIKSLRD